MTSTFITTINTKEYDLPSEFISGNSRRIVRFIACHVSYNDENKSEGINTDSPSYFYAKRKSDSGYFRGDPSKIIVHSDLAQGNIGPSNDTCNNFVSFCNLGFKNDRIFYLLKNIRTIKFWFTYLNEDIELEEKYLRFVIELELIS